MKKIVVFLLLGAVWMGSCRYAGKRVHGNGNVKTEDRNPGNFNGVKSTGSFEVYVASGSPSVKIEAEENLLPFIETYIDGDVLNINTKEGYWLRTEKSMKVFVTAPGFKRIQSNGNGNIISQSKITNPSKIELVVHGNADIKVEADAPEIDAEITGNGGIYAKGQSKTFSGQVRGNGNIRAFDLMAEETNVRIVGNGDAEVFASMKLQVSIGGNGNVRYKGTAVPSTHITGNGNITKVD